MTLYLRPTQETVRDFLERKSEKIWKYSTPNEIIARCGSDRLPVIRVAHESYDYHAVALDAVEIERLMDEGLSIEYDIYLVKIADLLPNVERLEAQLKQQLRGEICSRVGRFAIPIELIERGDPFARAILDKVFIVRAEALAHAKEISYIAYSEMFDPIQLGMQAPMYLWTALSDDSGKITDLKVQKL